jgi:hypothetical protein
MRSIIGLGGLEKQGRSDSGPSEFITAILTALLIGSAGCIDSSAVAQGTKGAVTGDTAVLAWAALECSVYAEMAGRDLKEQERLFQLGYQSGLRFLDAARKGTLTEEEIRQKVPIGFKASGPTADFALGQVFGLISQESYDTIVKNDALGLQRPIDQWVTDPKVQKARADGEYRSRNCALIK